MNKKALKYVLIVSGIVLLLGLGIWGYKYIKNRNDDKKTNESETNLKELANLTSYESSSVGGYTLNYYYNGPIDVTTNGGVKCLLASTSSTCHKYNYYLTIYVNDSIKLKSSWMFYSYECSRFNSTTASKNMKKIVTTNAINSKFLIISLSNYTYEVNSNNNYLNKTYHPYTKVFDATTGDMIFAVPTNSNEIIKITGTFDGVSSNSFKNNMYLVGASAIYYLKSNYTLTDGNNVEVHKVQFDDSFDNKYYDDIIAYTKGNIKNI